MIGNHLTKAWARTQNHVTLSSAEAALYAMVKCTAEMLRIKFAMRAWGRDKSGILYADSSATLGIAKRRGAGQLRHINMSALWVQEVQDAYTFLKASTVPSFLCLPILVFHTSNGIPSDAASAIWITGPIAKFANPELLAPAAGDAALAGAPGEPAPGSPDAGAHAARQGRVPAAFFQRQDRGF